MKIWKLFLIFFISYPLLLCIVGVILVIIGLGFFQNAPWFLTMFIKAIGFPVVMVDIVLSKLISNLISKQASQYISIIIANFILSLFFTAMVIGIKAIVKKL
jgi:hypothetical protein